MELETILELARQDMQRQGYDDKQPSGRPTWYAAEHERIKAERKAETKNVKAAIIKAGYQHVRVGHGTGTAFGWLHIYADRKPGQTWQEANQDLVRIAQAVTGRHGEYDRIGVNVSGSSVVQLSPS